MLYFSFFCVVGARRGNKKKSNICILIYLAIKKNKETKNNMLSRVLSSVLVYLYVTTKDLSGAACQSVTAGPSPQPVAVASVLGVDRSDG